MIFAKSPLVSIITPSYNQGEYIEETICSVLAQSYANIEYIVVDGASTDSTAGILSKYSDKISRVISEPDSGQASAINKGIKLAHGDIIGWTNSDDILYGGAIEAIVDAFESNPGADVVYGNVDYGASAEQVNHTIYGQAFDFLHSFRRLVIPMPQQGCFWKRSAMLKCGVLNEEWHYVLDRDYFIRLADRCSLVYVDKSMGLFRSHPDSKSVLMNVKWSCELVRLYTSYFSLASFCHPIHEYESEVMAAVFASSALLAIKSRYYTLGLRYIFMAFKSDPLLLIRPFFLSRIGVMQ